MAWERTTTKFHGRSYHAVIMRTTFSLYKGDNFFMTSEERREARYQRRAQHRRDKIDARSRACGDFEQIFSFENLYASGHLCAKGVSWKSSTQRYRFNLVSHTAETRKQLLDGTYKSKGFYEFQLYDRGKFRRIRSIHISERVVQRTLCDKVIIPAFQPAFIYDNGASMAGKGIDFAMDRLNCNLQRHWRKHGMKGGILQFDFSDFFGSAQHWPVQQELERRVHDPRVRELANTFLENFGSVGYGLGSQISQISALMYANRVDHVIKEELRIKGYGRYMDDGYLIHEDMDYLKHCLERIDEVCKSLGITLNRKKTKLVPIQTGITFLKTKFVLTDTGKVIRKMSRPSMRAMRRKLFIFKKWVVSGKFTLEDVRTAYESWRGHMRRGNAFHAIARTDRYFQHLFGFHPNNKTIWRSEKLCITH